MGLRIRVRGLDEMRQRVEEIKRRARAGAERAVRREVEALADDMRRRAPVGSASDGTRGDPPLGKSIVEHADGLEGRAGPTARHAPFIEHGTRSRPARRFVRPAAEKARRRFPNRVADDIRRELQ